MKKMNNKGFSLIELIIVIAIMAVLVAIIAPNLTKYLGKSKQETDKTNRAEIVKQVKNAIAEAATDDSQTILIAGAETSATSSATYTISRTTAGVISVTPSDATNNTVFANMVKDVIDTDTKVASKAEPSKTTIVVTVTGTASGGYTVTAEHS